MAADPEVIDAINATMVSNGVKAINADSVRNLLLLMAEKLGGGSGGGSGDGALRVIVPELMVLGPEFIDMGELSPTSWEETKPIIEADGIDVSEYDAVVKAAFEHNANVAQQIIAKAKAGQGASVVLDQTPYFTAAFNIQLQISPELAGWYEGFGVCGVQPAGLFMQYTKPTPEGEAMMGGDVFECMLAPAGNIIREGMNATYPSNMLIYLNLDGSLQFMEIESETESGS